MGEVGLVFSGKCNLVEPMINVSFHIEIAEYHQGAQEGQAMFYWYQTVSYLQINKERGGRLKP